MKSETSHLSVKRKRYKPSPRDMDTRISGRLHHDVKNVKKAAKKAKFFEMQKLVKKLKNLRKEEKNTIQIADVEKHLDFLKTLEPGLLATSALKTKLNKSKVLRESTDVQKALAKELGASPDPLPTDYTESILYNGLLSSKLMATEINRVVKSYQSLILGNATNITGLDEDEALEAGRMKKRFKMQGPNPVKLGEPSVGVGFGDATPGIVGFLDTNSGDEPDEGDTASNQEDALPSEFSEFQGALDASGGKLESRIASATTRAEATSTTSEARSTFLPSLSVGFVRGAYESDFSDSEAKVADFDVKKNRRGQRARRAIWEKKYGRNANHKKKELGTGKKRFGHDMRPKTGVDQRSSSYRRALPWPQTKDTSSHHRKHITQKDRDNKALHPSWEAKRKLKETQSANIVPSQGKKIVFG